MAASASRNQSRVSIDCNLRGGRRRAADEADRLLHREQTVETRLLRSPLRPFTRAWMEDRHDGHQCRSRVDCQRTSGDRTVASRDSQVRGAAGSVGAIAIAI